MSSQGGEGQKLPILLSKKTTKRGGGGQKLPILRRHSIWTAPSSAWRVEKLVLIQYYIEESDLYLKFRWGTQIREQLWLP